MRNLTAAILASLALLSPGGIGAVAQQQEQQREPAIVNGHRIQPRADEFKGDHSDVPPGQAKYVTCVAGAILDVIVDLRADSPSFGKWEAVKLDAVTRRAVFLAEGLGHAFTALTDGATALYLCSTPYAPGREHGVHPLDPAIGIAWPADGDCAPVLSEKDAAAPTLEEALRAGQLPRYEDCTAYQDVLRAERA